MNQPSPPPIPIHRVRLLSHPVSFKATKIYAATGNTITHNHPETDYSFEDRRG